MPSTSSSLKQFDNLPPGLLDIPVEALHTLVPEPALFHLPGKRPETLFVSVLLHGNESTGFLAVQQLLQKYREQSLPRGLTLFFGNTQAARHNLRRLDGQPDFNRIWPGTGLPASAETAWAAQICQVMRRRGVFASVDVHNNTGRNPHYACINKLEPEFLHLGALFGRLLVYFTQPKGIQSGAFAEFCPAVTLNAAGPANLTAPSTRSSFWTVACICASFRRIRLPGRMSISSIRWPRFVSPRTPVSALRKPVPICCWTAGWSG